METGKRKRQPTKRVMKKKVTRRTSRHSVIPGLLKTRGEEKKVLFTGQATSGSSTLALNTTGTIQCLNLIQVGSSMFNRIGRRLEMVSVRFSGNLSFITSLGANRNSITDYGRIIVVYDRQTNGAYPAITDVLQDTDQAGNNTTSALSGLNMNNRERFVTILDHRFSIPACSNEIFSAGAAAYEGPTDSFQPRPCIDEYRRLSKLTTHYKADSNPAVIGDISTGGLYVISLANLASGSENFLINPWNVRLKYVDV